MTGLDSFPDKEFQEIRLVNRERGYNLAMLDLNETLRMVLNLENVVLITKIEELMKAHEEIRKRTGYNDTKD